MKQKLTDRFVKNASPGFYRDAGCPTLNLRVLPFGARSWVQRLTVHGRERAMGLGGYPVVSLAEARDKALENRRLARAGGDPTALGRRKAVPTFEVACGKVIAFHADGWKDSGKSAAQWRASLRDYAMPQLGDMPVSAIEPRHVIACLLPIWNEKRETARRVRQRISAVMKWAVAEGYRTDDPAGEVLTAALPKNGTTRKHHRALPHAQVGEALAQVRASEAWPATKLALEFTVLTASRSGEVRGARWEEIDWDAEVWTVPADRMKAKKSHRVPLSGRALEILREAESLRDGSGLVFASVNGKALSDSTMSKLLREQRVGCVVHGFRSSFRDWCAETSVDRAAAEAALAHVVKGVEGAYFRSDMLNARRELMQDWAEYIST